MARSLTYRDAHALMNLIVKQATGQQAITVVDASTFVSAGETVLATGTENTLNALSIVMGRTLMAVRPYKAKLQVIQALNTGMYTSRLRKISFYAKGAKESGWVNTQTHDKNLYNGYDNGSNGGNSVASMWEQDKPAVLEMNFGGSSVWDFELTVYENQLKAAFRSEDEFISLVNGIMAEKMNDIESTKEAFNRMVILNKIAGTYDLGTGVGAVMNGSVVNLTSAFNTRFGTNYTSAQLRSTYLKEFLAFFVSEFKLASDFMTERTAAYHWSPVQTIDGVQYDTILRHTPKDKQRAILYSPLFTEATANVLPEIFNPQYLNIDNYEGVTYWQSQQTRAAINFTPAIPDTTTGVQKAGNAVALDYVVGILYDVDGMMTDFQFEGADVTPLEARKKYRNTWFHNAKNAINDFTENTIIFIMSDN